MSEIGSSLTHLLEISRKIQAEKEELQRAIDSLVVQEDPLPPLYQRQRQLQKRKEELEREVIPSFSYLGLVIEQFHWKTGIDEFIPCLIQLLKPFLSIHLCDTYETSKELLMKHKPIRIWVMERLTQRRLPPSTIQEGSITLIHPSTLLADDTTPNNLINAVCANTYFLKEGDPKALTPIISKHSIRVITMDGSIHSVVFLFVGLPIERIAIRRVHPHRSVSLEKNHSPVSSKGVDGCLSRVTRA